MSDSTESRPHQLTQSSSAGSRGDGETARETVTGGDLPLDLVPHGPHDFSWVIDALTDRRDEILQRWLDAAAGQPFHRQHRERVVTDHIPYLFDALLRFLRRGGRRRLDPGTPLDDPDVLSAASSHARSRADQGLQPSDVVVEFRLLRREIWRALHLQLDDDAPLEDVTSTELLVNDALDGAIALGLAEMTERIEEIREDFLVTTVHDVRQPITTIKGTAQMTERHLERHDVDPERLAEALRQITAQADRMTTLLDTLVDASRAALGQLTMTRSDVDLPDLLRSTVELLPPDQRDRIQFVVIEGSSRTGTWDSDRLRQVFTNLLHNAVKYAPDDSPIEVSYRGDATDVEISVRDHGLGIAPEELPKLFRRYHRSADAIAQGFDGLGLGLYLCKQIIETHGGRIWAESDGSGTGTTMHIRLPRTVPEQPTG